MAVAARGRSFKSRPREPAAVAIEPEGSTDSPGGADDGRDDGVAAASRHDRLVRHPTPGPGNSLSGWPAIRSPWRVAVQYAVIVLARPCPSLRLKNWLFRRLGMTVERGAVWALESTPDVFWPNLITVGEDAIVGYDATVLCHEFLQDEYRTGEVVIGPRAMIGAGAVVLPGVHVGAEASVGANSVVDRDVPAGATVVGVPAKPVERPAE